MAILDIACFPNPVLRKETAVVLEFGEELGRLIRDMWETMYDAGGVGLAAPQVGVSLKVIVIDWNENKRVLINPEILSEEGEELCDEGCLSFPGIFEEIKRPTKIRVRYQDEEGRLQEEEIEGFLARVFAHEIDHLSGRLLIDNMSQIKRTFLRKKLERRAKAGV